MRERVLWVQRVEQVAVLAAIPAWGRLLLVPAWALRLWAEVLAPPWEPEVPWALAEAPEKLLVRCAARTGLGVRPFPGASAPEVSELSLARVWVPALLRAWVSASVPLLVQLLVRAGVSPSVLHCEPLWFPDLTPLLAQFAEWFWFQTRAQFFPRFWIQPWSRFWARSLVLPLALSLIRS